MRELSALGGVEESLDGFRVVLDYMDNSCLSSRMTGRTEPFPTVEVWPVAVRVHRTMVCARNAADPCGSSVVRAALMFGQGASRSRSSSWRWSSGTAASVSGFISTLRRIRPAGTSASRWWPRAASAGRVDGVGREEQRLGRRERHPGGQRVRDWPVDLGQPVARREVGEDVELRRLVEAQLVARLDQLRPVQRGPAAGAQHRTEAVGGQREQRRVSHSAAAAAPAREHSSEISPRCRSSEVK